MRLSPNYHGLLPDVGNLESKSRQHRIAVDGGWIFEDLNRLVRKVEKGKGNECDTRPILSGPVFKVGTNVSTTSPRFSARQSHDDQFLPGREFEVKFAVVETKFDKLFVG